MKYLTTLLLAIFLTSVSWSQDAEISGDEEAQETDVSAPGDRDDEDDVDKPGYEKEDDDDFIPSQEVSADQTLAFPVDI